MSSFQSFDRSAFFRRGVVRIEAAVLAALGVDPDEYDLDDPYVGPFSQYPHRDLELLCLGHPPEITMVHTESFNSEKIKLYNHVLSVIDQANGIKLVSSQVAPLRDKACVLASDFLTWYETRYLHQSSEQNSVPMKGVEERQKQPDKPKFDESSIDDLMSKYSSDTRVTDFINFFQERSFQLLSSILDACVQGREKSPNISAVQNAISDCLFKPVSNGRASPEVRGIVSLFEIKKRLLSDKVGKS